MVARAAHDWQIALVPDGLGYHYTATLVGVLWVSGWIRAAPAPAEPGASVERQRQNEARATVLAIAQLAMERAS